MSSFPILRELLKIWLPKANQSGYLFLDIQTTEKFNTGLLLYETQPASKPTGADDMI